MSSENINPPIKRRQGSTLPAPTMPVNIRFPIPEFAEVRDAAAIQALPYSTFIRQSAVLEARRVLKKAREEEAASC